MSPLPSPAPPRTRRAPALAVALALLSAFVFAACDRAGAAGRPVERETRADGSVVVRYGALPSQPVLALTPDVRIGSLEGEGPETFGDVRGLEVGLDGTIYVLDFLAAEVRAFGPDGRHVATLARRGEGPGELRQANGLAFGPDGTLWVQDHGARALIGFSTDRQEVGRHPMIVNGFGFLWDGTIDHEGVFWQSWSHSDLLFDRTEQGLVEGTSRRFYKSFDPRTQAYDSVFLGHARIRSFRVSLGESGGMVLGVPFTPGLLAAKDVAGGIWVAASEAYRLARLDPAGDTALVLEVAMEPLPVTAEDRAAWRARSASTLERAPAAREVESLFPARKPVLAGLLVDDDGRLWVQRIVADGEPPLLDVFAPDAEYLGSVRLPPDSWITFTPVIRRGHLHALVRDELDVPYVIRAPVPDFEAGRG